ncbi:MAG: LTA synthase family protein, partial [Candidatus Accumulibacter sp.]|nr:LTA synthase family protein [Accumulibacter sp.]
MGPLHLEAKLRSGEAAGVFSAAGWLRELTIYRRHRACGPHGGHAARAGLEALPGRSGLCWYGDHVPIMPDVYRALGAPGGQTDYFIWRKNGPA